MCHFMVTLTLALTSDLVKMQFLQNMVMLHIKIKGMELFALTRTLDF